MRSTIDPRAIAIGAVVDNVVTLVLVYLLTDLPLSFIALAGLLSTAIGGYIAGRIARVAPLRHGAGVGLVALGIGVLSLVGSAAELPEWYLASTFALVVPAGMLGGLVARLLNDKRLAGRCQRTARTGEHREKLFRDEAMSKRARV
jgi:hypothetical protein